MMLLVTKKRLATPNLPVLNGLLNQNWCQSAKMTQKMEAFL
jgi:hypothetical protein